MKKGKIWTVVNYSEQSMTKLYTTRPSGQSPQCEEWEGTGQWYMTATVCCYALDHSAIRAISTVRTMGRNWAVVYDSNCLLLRSRPLGHQGRPHSVKNGKGTGQWYMTATVCCYALDHSAIRAGPTVRRMGRNRAEVYDSNCLLLRSRPLGHQGNLHSVKNGKEPGSGI